MIYLLLYDHYSEDTEDARIDVTDNSGIWARNNDGEDARQRQMKITHSLQITAICPVDDKPDVYDCFISAKRIIKVEDILAAVQETSQMKVYQEDLCQELHRRLACEVRLVGYHSGVKTEVVCG